MKYEYRSRQSGGSIEHEARLPNGKIFATSSGKLPRQIEAAKKLLEKQVKEYHETRSK